MSLSVSIHAPTQGATFGNSCSSNTFGFQSTLPRRERRYSSCGTYLPSSRFNPRSRAGSDGRRAHHVSMAQVSIHAPARGATLSGSPVCSSSEFQSTLPRGERRVSRYTPQIGTYCFNPRSRAGSDVDAPSYDADAKVSIHAPARGATCCRSFCRSLQISFNPRSRAGSDVTHCNLFKDSIVSIHAPARGATANVRSFGAYLNVSIHAPARGATTFA